MDDREQQKQEEQAKKDLLSAERVRLAGELFKRIPHMVGDYKGMLGTKKNSLLVGSMVFAYNKALQETIKFILKENQDV